MFQEYKPTWMVSAIYQITPEQLKKHGIKAVLTDLDNTLIAWNNPNGTEELRQWLKQMDAAKIPVVVVSNNNHKRIAHALAPFGLDFVSRALKPFARGIKAGYQKLGMKKEDVVMVGDQIMTDIRGANRAGVKSILVKPVVATDGWNTRINRFFERKIMKHLQKNNPDMKWQGELND